MAVGTKFWEYGCVSLPLVHALSLLFSLLQVIGNLIELMKDPNIQVKDSAAWTLGRVCEHVPETVLNERYLLSLLGALVEGLGGEPRVATNVCWVRSVVCLRRYIYLALSCIAKK